MIKDVIHAEAGGAIDDIAVSTLGNQPGEILDAIDIDRSACSACWAATRGSWCICAKQSRLGEIVER